MPRVLLTLLALLALLPAAAHAQSTAVQSGAAERAAAALRTDPVYVAPDADPGLTAAERGSIRRAISGANAGPVYVAVLEPEAVNEAGGDPGALLREVALAMDRPGTFVLVAGRTLRAGSTLLPEGRAGELAREAIDARRGDGLAAILRDLVGRVGEARAAGPDDGRERSGDGAPGWLLLALLGIPAALFATRAVRRRREERAEMEEVRATAHQDVVALGDDIRSLDLDIEMPGVDRAARDDYERALACYDRANEALRIARRPEDLGAVTEAVEEGRFAIVVAKARLEGRRPPERRPPCFFDPRHGPSVRDVEWAPPGGAPRPVPACAADAVAIEEGRDPSVREVMVGGAPTPYWNASPAYGGWAGGFYGGFGGGFGGIGLLPGLLMGTMLGSALGGWGHAGDAWAGDHGGDMGGGDFGGGLGGGVFGGGGFGAFGGGDF